MEIKLELEFRFPDGIGSYNEALEYLQYQLGFGECACDCDNPFLNCKGDDYEILSYEDSEIYD